MYGKLDPEKCYASVSEGMFSSYQCRKNPITTVDGKKYCLIHSPAYKAKKNAEEQKRWEAMKCKKCGSYLDKKWYVYCPMCGLKK